MTDEQLYAEADEMAAVFAARLAPVLDDGLVGLYLVGSYALRDLQAESDIDFVAVVSVDVSAAAVSALGSLHAWMSSTYPGLPLEGFYVHSDDLRAHSEHARHKRWRYHSGTLDERTEGLLVEWEVLRCHGHRVFGRPVEELRVFDASADVPAYSRRNLEEYWVPWIERTGSRLMGAPAIGPMRARAAWAAAWCVLGIPRLHAAIVDGEIVSKTEAGVRARRRFDARWHPVIDAASAYRRSADRATIKALASKRADALAFSRHALGLSLGLPL